MAVFEKRNFTHGTFLVGGRENIGRGEGFMHACVLGVLKNFQKKYFYSFCVSCFCLPKLKGYSRNYTFEIFYYKDYKKNQ